MKNLEPAIGLETGDLGIIRASSCNPQQSGESPESQNPQDTETSETEGILDDPDEGECAPRVPKEVVGVQGLKPLRWS